MKKFVLAAAVLAMPFASEPVQADDHMEATPELAEKDWYRVLYIDFHSGKMGRAVELIEAFEKVNDALGRENPMQFHLNTGSYDMMVVFKMRHGIAQMGWANDPDDEAWDAELARQLGGKDKVDAHWKEYQSLVRDSKVEIAHIDTD